MKALLTLGVVAVGFLTVGCETVAVVEDRGPSYRRSGYYDDRPRVVGYRETHYRDGRYDRGYDDRDYDRRSRDGYRSGSNVRIEDRTVNRTNINVRNVERTNVNRTNVRNVERTNENRTPTRVRVKGRPSNDDRDSERSENVRIRVRS